MVIIVAGAGSPLPLSVCLVGIPIKRSEGSLVTVKTFEKEGSDK